MSKRLVINILCVIMLLFKIISCSQNRANHPRYMSREFSQLTEEMSTLYAVVDSQNTYIESLRSMIEYLTISNENLSYEIELMSYRIFINDSFEIPMRYTFAGVEVDLSNDRVRERLQRIFNQELRRAPHFLPRSGRYFDLFHEIFDIHGIHHDLRYVAIAESNLSSMAYSQARASGIWQFIPSTARAYNLRMNSQIDERRNVILATHAACRYLLRAHRELNNRGVDCWLVTIASYNAGVGGVSRAIREQGGTDFASLIMRVEETNNYIWRAIAIKMIFEFEHLLFDTAFDRMPPLMETARLVPISLRGYHDIAEWAIAQGTNANTVWQLNPWINISRSRAGRFSQINHLLLPPGDFNILIPVESIPDNNRIALVEQRLSQRNNAPFLVGGSGQHRVVRGETLGGIARRHGVTVNDLRRWNNISGDMIFAGQLLNVQSRATTTSAATATATGVGRRHTVRSGDTLSSIARNNNISLANLRSWNNLTSDRIFPGQTLFIERPQPPTTTTTVEPRGRQYTVLQGDTISGIAQRLGVSTNHLVTLNNLQTNRRNGQNIIIIRPGQILEY